MGGGDKLIFHAVGHARLFGAGEITGSPHYNPDPLWKDRFPWKYPVRVDVAIPHVSDGPRLMQVAPSHVTGRLRAGAPYARLTAAEYQMLLNKLLAIPSVTTR